MGNNGYHGSDELYHTQRVDNEERWSFIRENISGSYHTLVDVGCAEGYFTNAAAEHGLEAIGIESNENRYKYAEHKFGDKDNIEFQRSVVTPDNVDDLPSADIALVLTVQHHWARFFDAEKASEMLKTIGCKTELLFYEPPGTFHLYEEEAIDREKSAEIYLKYLSDVFDGEEEIIEVQMFSHTDLDQYSDRHDPLFVINTTNI